MAPQLGWDWLWLPYSCRTEGAGIKHSTAGKGRCLNQGATDKVPRAGPETKASEHWPHKGPVGKGEVWSHKPTLELGKDVHRVCGIRLPHDSAQSISTIF